MAVSTIAAFWAVSFLLVITPGADWAYAIAAGLRYRTVVPAVGGMLAGYLLVTVVVAAGVAALLARSPLALTGLTTAGAAYLLWLGISTLTRPPAALGDPAEPPRSRVRQAIRGAGVSGLNPKALLLFLALLPQFTRPTAAWPVAAQIGLLGAVHTASCALIYTAVGTGARTILRPRPAAARTVARLSGVAMLLIGALLLFEQLLK
jgi:threonine/homoserine/homoserine lactone efflux protein